MDGVPGWRFRLSIREGVANLGPTFDKERADQEEDPGYDYHSPYWPSHYGQDDASCGEDYPIVKKNVTQFSQAVRFRPINTNTIPTCIPTSELKYLNSIHFI